MIRRWLAVFWCGLGLACQFDASGLGLGLPADATSRGDGAPSLRDLTTRDATLERGAMGDAEGSDAPRDLTGDHPEPADGPLPDGPLGDLAGDGWVDAAVDGPPPCPDPLVLASLGFEEPQIPDDWTLDNLKGTGLAMLDGNSAFVGSQSLRLEAVSGDCDSQNPAQTEFRLAFPLLTLPASCSSVRVRLRFRNLNHEYWEGDALWLDAKNASGSWTAQAEISAINTDQDRPSSWLLFDAPVAVVEDFQIGLRHVSQCTDAVLIDRLRVIARP